MLKKILPGILLLVFLFNSSGAGIAWVFLIREHKAAISRLEKEAVATETFHFSATTENLDRLVKGYEFISGHKRYDVLSVTRDASNIIVTCLADIDEEELLEGLEKSNDGPDAPLKKNNSLKKYAEDFLPAVTVLPPPDCISYSGMILTQVQHSVVYPSLPTPPPWSA